MDENRRLGRQDDVARFLAAAPDFLAVVDVLALDLFVVDFLAVDFFAAGFFAAARFMGAALCTASVRL